MENLTNQVLTLDNGNMYFVLRQAVYKGKTYYFCAEVTKDGENFTNKFIFLVKLDNEANFSVEEVTDKNILSVLAKNIKIE